VDSSVIWRLVVRNCDDKRVETILCRII
jgi:hypothetical protein